MRQCRLTAPVVAGGACCSFLFRSVWTVQCLRFDQNRYAIDWKQLIANRRSRGKKNLARFPRSTLRLKVQQLLEDLAYAFLLSGSPVQSVKPDMIGSL